MLCFFCSWFLQLPLSVDLLHVCVVMLWVDLLRLISSSYLCVLFVSSTCVIWYGLGWFGVWQALLV